MSYAAEIARSVRRYDPSEKAALREFQRTQFGATSRQVDDAFFEWLFERNPYADPAAPTLWLCKRDGVVVGQQASIPVVLKVGDEEHRAAWLVDWMVHPDWRLKGVAPALFAASMAHSELMLGLGFEDLPYRTVQRAGWRDITNLSLFVRPLDPYACTEALGTPRPLAKFAPGVLFRGSARAIGRIAGAMSRVSLDPIPAFDERVNDLWRKVSPEYPILVKRDFTNLRWRYDEGPFSALYDRYYLTRKGELVGYAVLRLEKRHGYIVGRVVDYLVERRSLAPLLALIVEELNAKGVIAVFFEHYLSRSEAILRSLGCLRVRASHKLMFKARDGASPLAASLTRAESWFVMPGDSDFDHVLICTYVRD